MSVINIKNINKYYGENHILKGISFDINKNDKVGLLGKNGSGKTTLFKILTGEEIFESGSFNILKDKKVEKLDQIPCYPELYTVNDVLRTSFKELYLILDKMDKLVNIMNDSYNESAINDYGMLQREFEDKDGYNIESEMDKVCGGLKIYEEMRNKKFNLLSGGEKTKIDLGRILLKNPDILLLDEPTNHLDISIVELLEEYIKSYNGIAIIISHDRVFLDNTVNKIIEIKDGKSELYQGNYSFYIKEKKLRYENQLNQYNQQNKKIKQLEKAAKRLHEWANRGDNESLHKKAFNIEKRISKIEKVEKPKQYKNLVGKFNSRDLKSKELITIDNISKKYGSKILFDNISLKVYKKEKIGIIGENGTGKTTLLKLILGEVNLDKGTIKLKENLKYIYLQQNVEFDNPNFSVLDTVRYKFEISEEKARRKLAKFHFVNKDVFKKVKNLSGGEKSRLKLCILMENKSDLLILDEPTNHLDIQSREWIESAIENYQGAILFVSHDRYFIKKFANRIWEVNNKIIDYYGNYNEFISWKDKIKNENNQKISTKKSKKSKKHTNNSNLKTDNSKEKLELEIELIEDKLKDIDSQIDKYNANYIKLEEYLKSKELLNEKLDLLYSKWIEF